MYSYRNSIKSDKSDELINIYLLRPIAGIIVWALYDTPITPNQVTLASIVSGIVAALFYLQGTAGAFIAAGLLISLKDVLDSADGQLARARQQQSRTGRFLDSIGDFIANAAVFGSIGWTLYQLTNEWLMLLMALLGFIGISLRISYHVFYQVQFLHLQKKYENNRITEEIREGDLDKGRFELTLQRIFQIMYSWQDTLMARIDEWSMKKTFQRKWKRSTQNVQHDQPSRSSESYSAWYSDSLALRTSGLLGFGTEFFLLMVCSVLNHLQIYLYLNVFLMNGIFLICIVYRRFVLSARCFAENDI